jgi:GTPase SAR1 family protein
MNTVTLQTGCDVICLVYDSSNPRSFEYCARIYLRYFSTTQLPVLVVANKSDKGVVRQDYILQPDFKKSMVGENIKVWWCKSSNF